MEKTFTVKGMTCMNCANHVKEALLKVDGVTSAKVDLEQKKATIEADSTVTDKALKDAVSDAGYFFIYIPILIMFQSILHQPPGIFPFISFIIRPSACQKCHDKGTLIPS